MAYTTYSISKIGYSHPDNNEDYCLIEKLGRDKIVMGVFDGCSSAIESHFASALIGKITKKLVKQVDALEFAEKRNISSEDAFHYLLENIFLELQRAQQSLNLSKFELMSTIVLAVFNFEQKNGFAIIIGDGILGLNGKKYEYDNGDKPDYMAYHLDKNYSGWKETTPQILKMSNIDDLSLASDGILSFDRFQVKNHKPISEEDLVSSLLFKKNAEKNYLHKTIVEIQENYGLTHMDDLSIVRLVTDINKLNK